MLLLQNKIRNGGILNTQTCHIYKTPFISFRIISDVPLKDTKAQQYFKDITPEAII